MQIKLHSMTDLITNSSTVIYTYSDASEGALREMINETFKVLNIDKKCDDVFDLSVTLEGTDTYRDYLYDQPEDYKNLKDWKAQELYIHNIIDKVTRKEIEKPEWMVDAETGNDDCRPGTVLNIVAKAPEYEKLATLIGKFLYSTDHEESSN